LSEPSFRLLDENVKSVDASISLPEVPDRTFRVRIYSPRNSDRNLPIVLYFHSGFWCTGDLDTDDLGCRAMIAHGNDLIVVSFEYGLSPENLWTVTLNDAEYAMTWLYNHATEYGGDVDKGFLVGGAIAGAQIAAICAIRARNHHPEIRLTGQCLVVPVIMSWREGEQLPQKWNELVTSHQENAHAPLLSELDLQCYLSLLNLSDSERLDENVFPVWADLHGLPPAYLALDGPDPLREEGYLYEKKLREAGVQTRTDHYEMPNW
jgi:versiconal hemiacetal acetate esterase